MSAMKQAFGLALAQIERIEGRPPAHAPFDG
jgi:hypothetical protein